MRIFNFVSVFLLIFLQICSSTFLKVIEDATGKEICSNFDHLNCTLVEINSSDLEKEEIFLPHPLRGNVMLHKQNIDKVGNVYVDEKGTQAIFSEEDGKVLGNVNFFDAGVFLIVPCGSKYSSVCHLWIKPKLTDEPDHDIEEDTEEDTQGNDYQLQGSRLTTHEQRLLQRGKDDDTTEVEVSVMFYYTEDVITEYGGSITQLVKEIVKIANLGFDNSKIPIKVKTHCIEALEVKDSVFRGVKEMEKFQEILRKKNRSIYRSADAAALLVGENGLNGGWGLGGYSLRYPKRLSITWWKKAASYYTFGHELGHNLGAHHNRNDASHGKNEEEIKKWNVGYGNFYKNYEHRTIMAYPYRGSERRNFFSGPSIYDNRYPTGTAREDNARNIKHFRFAMEDFGDESDTSCKNPTTGVRSCEEGKRYVGSMITHYKDVLSVEDCKVKCQNYRGCVYFSWYSNDYAYPRWRLDCDLWRSVSSKRIENGAISGSQGCIIGGSQSGTLKSHLEYPANYENYFFKEYPIVATGDKSKIQMTFVAFDIEDNSSGKCSYDYVKIVDADGTVLMDKTCGNKKPDDIVSRSNKVKVVFETDENTTKTGFKLEWRVVS